MEDEWRVGGSETQSTSVVLSRLPDSAATPDYLGDSADGNRALAQSCFSCF
jgi:hypothetical protein